MGCGSTKAVKPVATSTKEQSEEIDKSLRQELTTNHFKILCLGGGETGKSTFLKQLNVIYHKQTKVSERKMFAQVLQLNTMQTIQVLLRQCESFQYPLNEAERRLALLVNSHDVSDPMTPDVAIAVQELWKCDPIQQTYARRTEFWILDACGYYMSNCHRFVQSTFVPNDYDIVMSRRRTTGIVEAQFMDEGAKWTVVDVGGQRSERRKWMLCFDGVDAVIFFVNSAGFNRPLFEDNQVTEHQEALQLLESTFSNKIFKDTPVFLFFNKLDLFRDALDRGRPIGKYFPEYKGEMMEIPMLDHLSKLYQTKMPNGKPLAQVHFISACNRNDCQKGFKRVREYLISNKHNTIKKEGESGKTPQFGAEVFTQPREDTQTPQPGAPAPLISPTAVHTELPGSFDSTSNTTKTESNISQGDEPGLEKRDMPKGLPTLLLPRDVEPI